MIITHGDKKVFLSKDYGNTWIEIQPFRSLSDQGPSIRSLLKHKDILFIGTKIHAN